MHPQVYETWFSHLSDSALLNCLRVLIQDTSPSARFTGPKLRRWCSKLRHVQPAFPWKAVGYPLC